ncbi:hypothetical protein EDI29_13835 [Pectobacterium polonicum]|nr:hypothetical protein [Pectobacterium sp. IFB5596]TKY81695.1 hypothetical protein EDI29_13835 [Pectobacterium polonicum]
MLQLRTRKVLIITVNDCFAIIRDIYVIYHINNLVTHRFCETAQKNTSIIMLQKAEKSMIFDQERLAEPVITRLFCEIHFIYGSSITFSVRYK